MKCERGHFGTGMSECQVEKRSFTSQLYFLNVLSLLYENSDKLLIVLMFFFEQGQRNVRRTNDVDIFGYPVAVIFPLSDLKIIDEEGMPGMTLEHQIRK